MTRHTAYSKDIAEAEEKRNREQRVRNHAQQIFAAWIVTGKWVDPYTTCAQQCLVAATAFDEASTNWEF